MSRFATAATALAGVALAFVENGTAPQGIYSEDQSAFEATWNDNGENHTESNNRIEKPSLRGSDSQEWMGHQGRKLADEIDLADWQAGLNSTELREETAYHSKWNEFKDDVVSWSDMQLLQIENPKLTVHFPSSGRCEAMPDNDWCGTPRPKYQRAGAKPSCLNEVDVPSSVCLSKKATLSRTHKWDEGDGLMYTDIDTNGKICPWLWVVEFECQENLDSFRVFLSNAAANLWTMWSWITSP